MTIEKRTVLSQVECKPNGTVLVRLEKQVVEGDKVIANEYHRFRIDKDVAPERVRIEVDHHLNGMGYPSMEGTDFNRLLKLYEANA